MNIIKSLKSKAYTFIAIGAACLAVPHFAAAEMLVSDQVEVNDNVVRLGDIFDVNGPFSDDELFQAPPLGRKGVLSFKNLQAIANQYDLDWKNLHNYTKVTIIRKAKTIDVETIKSLIIDHAIANQYISGDTSQTRVNLNDNFKTITIAASDYSKFEISDFTYRPFSDQFNIEFKYFTNGRYRTQQLSGKVENMISIPVFANNIRRDQIIKLSDIKLIQLNSRRVAANVLLDVEDIVGKSAKNSIRAMQPVNENLLKLADLVKKNSIINLQFRMGRVRLNIKARALTTGADGSLIRVLNLQSGRQVDAIVTGIDQAMTLNSLQTNAKIASK
ncbi:MAG: flagellar basal body P-ring formation protein FlgA [OCS116 cluster bacterium]|nr:flagellar basal body P-ring formation protein FlgA [OCS116 cluster bacterium]